MYTRVGQVSKYMSEKEVKIGDEGWLECPLGAGLEDISMNYV